MRLRRVYLLGFSVLILASGWLFSERPVSANTCAACQVTLRPEDGVRRVFGLDLDLECPDENWSSQNWGNWGVDTGISNTWDGDQFKGWKDKDGHRQWNSCTNGEGVDPPDFVYYNDDGYTKQKADPDDWQYYANPSYVIQWECAEAFDETIYTTYNNTLDVYELDDFWYSSDDYADTLSYGNLDVLISCDGDNCFGESGETDSVNGSLDRISARINFKIWTSPDSYECE